MFDEFAPEVVVEVVPTKSSTADNADKASAEVKLDKSGTITKDDEDEKSPAFIIIDLGL